MKLADTVMSLLRGSAGATLALAVGCSSPASLELREISSAPHVAATAANVPPALLVPVPAIDPQPPESPTPALAASEITPAVPVVAVARPTRRRTRAQRNASAARPAQANRVVYDFSDISVVGCGRG